MTDRSVVSIATGERAITELAELASYVDGQSDAFCTSSGWLLAAARHLPATPVVITVRRGGAPVALAALSVTGRRGTRRITLLGGEMNDYGRFFYDDDRAAEVLAGAVVAWVTEQPRWAVTFSQLPPADPVAARLADRLSGAVVEPGPPIPQIVGIGTDYRISRNRRQQIGQATNRVASDGRTCEKVVVDELASLERWLPAVIDLRRRRDHACARRSHLDDPAVLAFYETVVRERVAQGAAVLDLFVVDGTVAGYALVMLDGDVHRYYDGRVAEGWQRYRGGMVCALVAVTRATETEGVTTYDWLRGRTDSKFGNHEIHRVELRAASHGWVTTVDEWEGTLRRRVKATLPAAAVRKIVAR